MKRLHLSLFFMAALGTVLTASAAPAEDVREVKAQDLVLKVPASWKQEQPSNNLRLAQFVVPAAEGDQEAAEMVVFPPFGGTIRQNVERWIEQFQSEGRKLKMTQGTSEQGKYILVDLSGTYNKPDGPPFQRRTKPAPGYRVVSVILTPEGRGNYFLKMTGEEQTVSESLEPFRNSFGADAEKEEEYRFD